MQQLKTALIQLTSGSDIAANIAKIEAMVAEAATKGAQLVALPENAFFMRAEGMAAPVFLQENHPGVQAAAAAAKRYGIWLLAGSVAILPEPSSFGLTEGSRAIEKDPSVRPKGDGERFHNRSLLFNPQGGIAAHYDKIHLFDVEVGDGQVYRESARFLAGDTLAVCRLPLATLGLTVCYDLRFPQLYRALAKAGANILAVPSAFTQVTGEAHWHVLLRARAIENGCFVIAPAQCGEHPGGRKTYGHSLVVDPWGKILADGGTGEGIVMADLDLNLVEQVRARLPSLEHDREFN